MGSIFLNNNTSVNVFYASCALAKRQQLAHNSIVHADYTILYSLFLANRSGQ